MRGLIIEVASVSGNASTAHVRNSLYLKKLTDFDICWNDETILQALKKKYDCLLFSYASHYASFNLIQELINQNPDAKRVWMINEYNCPAPTYIRKAGNFSVIANFDRIKGKKYKFVKDWLNVDLNSWIIPRKIQTLSEKKYGTIYYGTWRPDRQYYLEKYMKKDIYLSSSSKNHKFFREAGCTPKFIEKLSWQKNRETLSLFKHSLYCEDVHTHTHYNRMANRFYEALYCNVVPLFDVSCTETIKKSGYEIPESWMIEKYEDIGNFTGKDDQKIIKKLFDHALQVKEEETEKALKFIGVT